MRTSLLLALLAAGAVLAGPLTIVPTVAYTFDNCASGGSADQTVPAGSYLLKVFDEDIWLCEAETCATGGERYAPGERLHIQLPATSALSCRSTSSTGDLHLTRAQ